MGQKYSAKTYSHRRVLPLFANTDNITHWNQAIRRKDLPLDARVNISLGNNKKNTIEFKKFLVQIIN